jgi:vesicle transport protein SEC22
LRPYAFNDFDTFMQRTKKSYENPRATNNLDKVQAQLKETTQIMSKNLEDLLYRGDSLDRMGQMSSDLRESSKKYKRAAVRINWELLLKQVCLLRHYRVSWRSLIEQQYGPFAALGTIILFFIIWRFW